MLSTYDRFHNFSQARPGETKSLRALRREEQLLF